MAGLDPNPAQRLPQSYRRSDLEPRGGGPANLADILERVLDKGIVIAGDIQINLLDIELLTIKLRLLIASVDRAREMGINWWESDPQLSRDAQELAEENRELRDRLDRLERAIEPPREAAATAERAGAAERANGGADGN
jgi:Gas vesicle protein